MHLAMDNRMQWTRHLVICSKTALSYSYVKEGLSREPSIFRTETVLLWGSVRKGSHCLKHQWIPTEALFHLVSHRIAVSISSTCLYFGYSGRRKPGASYFNLLTHVHPSEATCKSSKEYQNGIRLFMQTLLHWQQISVSNFIHNHDLQHNSLQSGTAYQTLLLSTLLHVCTYTISQWLSIQSELRGPLFTHL